MPWPAASMVPGVVHEHREVVEPRVWSSRVAENEPLTETKLAQAGAGAGLPPTITARACARSR